MIVLSKMGGSRDQRTTPGRNHTRHISNHSNSRRHSNPIKTMAAGNSRGKLGRLSLTHHHSATIAGLMADTTDRIEQATEKALDELQEITRRIETAEAWDESHGVEVAGRVMAVALSMYAQLVQRAT